MLSPNEVWPPNYTEVYAWRARLLDAFQNDREFFLQALEFYKRHPVEFIDHWIDTFDPRNAGSGVPARLPFKLFKRQREFIQFLQACLVEQENGLNEKAREVGATFCCCGFSVWLWRFYAGASVGWGSRKEQLVDDIGNPDSIFEKIRMMVRSLPSLFLPDGFDDKRHLTYMSVVNPELESSITGECGDAIGRGGRKLIYFKDESAHYVHAESIEAALMDNTRIQIDISSVNGFGNIFHKKRTSGIDWHPGAVIPKGKIRVFTFDWRDHPAKTQEWYDLRKQSAQEQGLQAKFAQEVDRNYSASVDGIIIPLEYIQAAVDAHLHLEFGAVGTWGAGLDIADEGGDTNALSLRKGVVLKSCEEWGDRDSGYTARRAFKTCADTRALLIELQYDASGGFGTGIKAEANRLEAEGLMPKNVVIVPWLAGGKVQDPKSFSIPDDDASPRNEDLFTNFKAQAWWSVGQRFYRTWRARNDPDYTWNADDLISLSSNIPLLPKLMEELARPTASQGSRLKLVVDKKPNGAKSPNLADSAIQCFFPVKQYVAPSAVRGIQGHR